MYSPSLQVNLSDPDDLRAKIPAMEQHLEEREAALKDLTQEVEDWREMVRILRSRAGLRPRASILGPLLTGGAQPVQPAGPRIRRPRHKASPARDAAVAALTAPMRAADVAAAIERSGGTVPSANSVAAALNAAAETGRIQKIGPGLYAPVNYHPPDEPDGLLGSLNGSSATVTDDAQRFAPEPAEQHERGIE